MNIWLNADYDIPDFATLLRSHFGTGVKIICTDHNLDAPLRAYADAFYQEPADKAEFVRQHNIDVFIPREGMVEVRNHISDFTSTCKVLVEPNKILYNILNNKDQAYNLIDSFGVVRVPLACKVNNIVDLSRAIVEFTGKGKRVAIKKPVDIGGVSYREVVFGDTCDTLDSLPKRVISLKSLEQLYKYNPNLELLVMEQLEGPEISVDCIPDRTHPTFIPRLKELGKLREYYHDDTLDSVVKALMSRLDLVYPYNIQFMFSTSGRLTFLELNTRMSDGIHFSHALTGLNIPAIAVEKLLGNPVEIKETHIADKVLAVPTVVPLRDISGWDSTR